MTDASDAERQRRWRRYLIFSGAGGAAMVLVCAIADVPDPEHARRDGDRSVIAAHSAPEK